MMEALQGLTLLIGREQGQSRLLVAMDVNGRPKLAYIGGAGSVPASVSRCVPFEGSAHCKIEVDASGNMIVTNLKPQNATMVNGIEVMSKRVSHDDRLTLGRGNYDVNVGTIIDAATQTLIVQQGRQRPPTQPAGAGVGTAAAAGAATTYSLRPLEHVWKRYYEATNKLNDKQRNINLLRSVTPIFTIGSGVIAGIAKSCNGAEFVLPLTITLTVIGLILMIYSFVRAYQFNSVKEKELITQEFQRNYVCPNPECRHFVGNQPYEIIRQNKVCPYCKCKLTAD